MNNGPGSCTSPPSAGPAGDLSSLRSSSSARGVCRSAENCGWDDPLLAADVEGRVVGDADPCSNVAEEMHDDEVAPDIVDDRNVPGANASTLRIHSMWRAWPRIIIRGGSGFSLFFRAQCKKAKGDGSVHSTASVWPMPLPSWELRFAGSKDHVEESMLSIIDLQVSFLNFLHLGRPEFPPESICGRKHLNDGQLLVVRRLLRLQGAWKNCGDIPAAALGRTASKQERQEVVLNDLAVVASSDVAGLKKYEKGTCKVNFSRPTTGLGKVVGRVKKADISGAQSIVASRIKMEGRPVFEPGPFLDDTSAELYDKPFCQNIQPEDLPSSPPRVQVHASLHERISLLKLLQRSGRLVFRSAKEVKVGHGNGLFCVAKSLDVDRLILDGRPANMLQQPPNRFIMTMGAASTLLGICLGRKEKLLMSGDDLSNFFYTFKVGYERGTRNFLDWAIPTHLVRDFPNFPEHLKDEKIVYGCLSSLAMGDSAACEYAQTSHISMGLQSGAFQASHLVSIHGRVPRSRLMAGVIIDDFILLERVCIDATIGLELDDRRKLMHAMYGKVGLEAHPTKGFSNCSKASFWGADIDGDAGLIQASVFRCASLAWVTSRVASLRVCAVSLLQVLAGGFVSVFGFRRRIMSLLDLIYAAQCGRDERDIIQLSDALVDELWSLAILCPLAVTDLRAVFSSEIFMVDASNWGEAVVRSELDEGLRSEIHRHCLNKSSWTKLLSPFKAHLRGKGALDSSDELPGDQVREVAARGLQYDVCWKRKARRARHINIGEIRAFLKAECIGGAAGDVRIPIGGDSQVVCGAICKGRSASPALNRELQKSLPITLGNGIYSSSGYARSSHNPSDDPTRGVELRGPAVELPFWWKRAALGDYGPLDAFLGDCGLKPEEIAGYPPLDELHVKGCSPLDLHCCSKGRKMHKKVSEKLKLRKPPTTVLDDSIPGARKWDAWVYEDLMTFGKEKFFLNEGVSWPPNVRGFLDLYSGVKGFARSAIFHGASWVLTVDFIDGPQCDLLDKSVQRRITRWVPAGVFEHVSGAPICSSFSRAITPAVRSKEEPFGIIPIRFAMVQKIEDGNEHSSFLAGLITICILLGISYWVENPDSSFLWSMPEWRNLPRNAAANFWRVDFCRFKTPWRKRTRFLCSGSLAGSKMLCTRDHQHRVLRGRSSFHKKSWTKVAEPYPKGLCSHLAWHVCSDLNILRPNLSLTCRSDHRRIGEAKNPGPRRPTERTREFGAIDRVELIRPETGLIGQRQWSLFLSWIEAVLGSDFIDIVWRAPSLVGYLLAAFGRHSYNKGAALFNFRHLVVFSQRNFPSVKPFLQPAWETVSRWQELEPTDHRRPLPFKLVQAMFSLAVSWKWYRVAAITMLAFLGCCRPGEVLHAERSHLILPQDISQDDGVVFLRIVKPKPGRRGMGRVQHARLVDVDFARFLWWLYGQAPPHCLLYGGSASAYRTRWDKLLASLQIPKSAELTPGGLRAGGTVELYRRGTAILDILWALRLKNVETLQHYLQEVSTKITLLDLPILAKNNITALSSMYPFFVSIPGSGAG